MNDERRIALRVDTKPGIILVHDKISGTNLGTIANISSTGFMLVADRFIETDSVFQLRLLSDTEELAIDIGTICLWTTEASSTSSFWSGFHIIDISESAQNNLDTLVDHMQ